MSKIDIFLEMMVQKKVSRAIMSGEKPFVLTIAGQKTEGSVTPTKQLQQILEAITPEYLKPQLDPENQQGPTTFTFPYASICGNFNFAVEIFAGDIQVTITPAKAAPTEKPIESAISPQLAKQSSQPEVLSATTPSATELANPQSETHCRKCGAEKLPSASFCPACGESFRVQAKTNVSVIEQADGNGTRAEIIQYESLSGSDDIHVAQPLFYAQQIGVRLKQVKITLNGGAVVVEAGALHFMKGHITMESSVGGVEGFAKKLASNMLTKETMFKPRYTGRGEVYLEPSFGHFVVTHLDNEEMIVDKGMFYASEASIEVGVATQKNISSALFGGEGFFQTRLFGTGWCVLNCPVPSDEVIRYQLHNDRLCVDGNFALLRKGQINFTVERSTKSFLGSLTSGEGVLQTFTGTGEVWIAPTQGTYARIKQNGMQITAAGKGSSGTNT